MRNLLALLAALCLTMVIAGWYLNWYSVHSVPAADGHRKLSIDINTAKLSDDVQRGGESFWNFIDKARKPDTTSEVKTDASPETPKKEPDGKKNTVPMPPSK
jgi:hypothetical protein